MSNAYASWYEKAKEYIQEAHISIPEEATIKERRSIISAAYPWGQRKFHPYKMWLKAQSEYMRRYEKSDEDIPEKHLSPLERMMRKAKRND